MIGSVCKDITGLLAIYFYSFSICIRFSFSGFKVFLEILNALMTFVLYTSEAKTKKKVILQFLITNV